MCYQCRKRVAGCCCWNECLCLALVICKAPLPSPLCMQPCTCVCNWWVWSSHLIGEVILYMGEHGCVWANGATGILYIRFYELVDHFYCRDNYSLQLVSKAVGTLVPILWLGIRGNTNIKTPQGGREAATSSWNALGESLTCVLAAVLYSPIMHC